jgi:hypothetical protein
MAACTKIAYLGWGIGMRSFDFTGISGHAMTATLLPHIGARLGSDGHSIRPGQPHPSNRRLKPTRKFGRLRSISHKARREEGGNFDGSPRACFTLESNP